MVRGRRTRRAAASASTTTTTTVCAATGSLSPKANGSSPLVQQNGVGAVKMMTTSKGNVVLVDDFCCASPKRKEYKIDELLLNNGAVQNGCGGYTLGGGSGDATQLTTSPTKTRMALRGTQNSQSNGVGAGVTNGAPVSVTANGRLCPVAGNEITRFLLSQSKSKSRKARKKSPNFELVNDDTCDSFTHATSIQDPQGTTATTNGCAGVVKMEQEVEEEEGESEMHPFQMFGRLPIGNGMVAAENIFLQEPVLKLTVDEAACVLVQPKSEPVEVVVGGDERQKKKGGEGSATAVALTNQDSNSGDSGVVIDKLQEQVNGAVAAQSATPKPLLNVSRPRVPTTPHRILCPSSPQLNGANGEAGDKEEEGMAVEGETNSEEDLQMTKRQLILPTKEEDDAEEQYPAECKQQNGTVKTVVKSEPGGAPMKAPKSNGVGKLPATAAAATVGHQSTMEDFFKVRRSVRKTKKEVEREEQLAIEKAILSACDVGLAVKMFENKGRGIVGTRPFARGEFVVEYVGEFISMAEANRREKLYAQDQNTGCYMYYFKHKNKQYCIDATEETGKLGRLVNHSRNGNLMTRTVEVKGQPHLVLIAKEDIEEGRELNYDYGDRSKEALLHHPWLAY